ncbi:MAG TPA: phosphotransferase [Fimbriimonadaceae bacterium]|nr:phosphotransferase [Fimbriimonadaceae bacterium]
MQDEPQVEPKRIVETLDASYGVVASAIRFLPVGYDPYAAVYRLDASDGQAFFLKVRLDSTCGKGLAISRALADRGIANILAPLRSRNGKLMEAFDGHGLIVYPFVEGRDAAQAGMSDSQWIEFGKTLRLVHDSGLAAPGARTESFSLPSAKLLRAVAQAAEKVYESSAATEFAQFWLDRSEAILDIVRIAEDLAAGLRSRSFDFALCHSDVHAANVLVADDGRIWILDWDDPILAPRERDLLFVVGSRISRRVEPREEELFFAGYGPWEVDRDLLRYYRLERLVEDLGEFARSIFRDSQISEATRREYSAIVRGFFEPGADLDHALG